MGSIRAIFRSELAALAGLALTRCGPIGRLSVRRVIPRTSLEAFDDLGEPRVIRLLGDYRKQGEKEQRRLVINDEPIPGFNLSEAEVVRTIYRMSGVEKKACQKIVDHLHRAGIPPVSSEGFARSEEGKRKRRNAPIWRPSHVRNMIVSRTYMGQHLFGKRSKTRGRIIIRAINAGNRVRITPRAPLHFDEDDSGPVRRDVPFKPADPFMLRDVVTILFDCRLRPEECYRLKWVRDGGIEVFMGKGRASRRRVPLSARLLAILDMRRTS